MTPFVSLCAVDPREDAELLGSWVDRRDEAALAALVRRHGPLVARVCRAVLRNAADADDAFQATFLVLTESAGSIRRAEALPAWLHGVAHRVAHRLLARRRGCPLEDGAAARDPDPARQAALRELQQALHDEVNGLPRRYRDPFVLCYLTGLSREEAAARLGWNPGTLSTRLARAKLLLRDRLSRRGFELGAALAAVALVVPPASATAAAVRASRFAPVGTSDTARALAAEVMRGGRPPGWAVGLWALGLAAATLLAVAPDRPPPEPAAAPAPVRAIARGPDPDERPAPKRPPVRAVRVVNHPTAFAPDGRTLAAGVGAEVRFVDVEPTRLRPARGAHPMTVECLAFAPDGRVLVAGGHGFAPNRFGCVAAFDPATGVVKWAADLPRAATALAFAPGGDRLIVVSGDRSLRVLDAGTGAAVPVPLPPRLAGVDPQVPPAWGPDGRVALSTSRDPVLVWNPATGAVVAPSVRLGHPTAFQFSAGGDRLAVGAADGTVALWDVGGARVVRCAAPPGAGVVQLRWTPDGGTVVAAGETGAVQRFDAGTGQLLSSCPGGETAAFPDLAPDGATFARIENGAWVRFRDATTERLLGTTLFSTHPPARGALSATGDRFAVVGHDGVARVWDRGTGELLLARGAAAAGKRAHALAFDARGRLLVGCSPRACVLSAAEPPGTVWTAGGTAVAAALAGDGRVVWIDAGGTLTVEGLDGTVYHRVATGEAGVSELAFVPGREWFAAVVPDRGMVRVLDAGGREVHRFAARDPVALAVDPDGDTLGVLLKANGRVARWTLATGRELPRISGNVSGFALLPGGRVATGHFDGGLVLRDRDGAPRARHQALTKPVRSVSATADGRVILAAGDSGTVALWEPDE